jgi:hypothetical protein
MGTVHECSQRAPQDLESLLNGSTATCHADTATAVRGSIWTTTRRAINTAVLRLFDPESTPGTESLVLASIHAAIRKKLVVPYTAIRWAMGSGILIGMVVAVLVLGLIIA